jgi:hypothetical protein
MSNGKCGGLAIPIFIRNMQYHLTTAEVYADGAISVWGFVDLELFDEKLRKGWVWPAPPNGERISIFNLGLSDCVEGDWQQTPQSIRSKVHAALKELNPELMGLLDMQGSNSEYKSKIRTLEMEAVLPSPTKRSEQGMVVIGKEVPVFVADVDRFRLEHLFIFADGVLRIGAQGSFVDLESIKRDFVSGQLTTKVPDGTRIAIEGLGSFTTARGSWAVPPRERVREIESIISQYKGEPNPIDMCRVAYRAYEKDPSPGNRSALKNAYETVPEHLRIYCGDMDTKDHAIRRALYGQPPLASG